MHIVLYIVLLWVGAIFGFFISLWVLHRIRNYGGVIEIEADEIREKIVYSLVLFDDPEKLIFEKDVLFRIDTPVEEADRE